MGKGGKGRRGGKGGKRGGKKWTGGGTRGNKKTREEKISRENAVLDRVLEKKRRREEDEISSSDEEDVGDILMNDKTDHDDLLQSFGVLKSRKIEDSEDESEAEPSIDENEEMMEEDLSDLLLEEEEDEEVEEEEEEESNSPLPEAEEQHSAITEPWSHHFSEKPPSLQPLSASPPWQKISLAPQVQTTSPSRPQLPVEDPFSAVLSTYSDLFYPLRTWDNEEQIINANVRHILSHLGRSYSCINGNDKQIKEKNIDTSECDDYRDQGFLRAKVLVLLPMRNICLEYLLRLKEWAGIADEDAANWERFVEDFSELDQEKDPKFAKRTVDYKKQFNGNIDDKFCFGVTLRKKSMSVFTTFSKSDIIFASPMGLCSTVLKNTRQGTDFLSSIEVLIVDQAGCIQLQNFTWLHKALEMLNNLPQDMSRCGDIFRIRSDYLDGNAKEYRQTAIYSRFESAELSSLFKSFSNRSGAVRCSRDYSGELTRVINSAKHLFHRVDVSSVKASPDERFEFFKQKVFPRLTEGLYSNIGSLSTIIVVPSYFDYTRLRGFFESVDRDSFCELCEYTPPKEMHWNIKEFTTRKRSFLLMTERFYFFRRYVVQQAKSVIFYQLPHCTWFYHEIANNIRSESSPTVLTLYSKLDYLQMLRVLGTSRTRKILTADKPTHMFC
eukprot:TRINITY_DN2089_c1_g1_i1.p1 TRINITY_DN2089_c1_g1~~TRINITY_DN2089_c1_g1_i1.p1  ORF type:complete len:679 (+),score=124.05 TRINITY_DN2089_c1_g1_i1:37-2037(+)